MLEKEIEVFDKNLPSFLRDHEGEFVLIKNKEVEFFKNDEDAINAGLQKYGANDSFLVREVVMHQPKIELPAFAIGA